MQLPPGYRLTTVLARRGDVEVVRAEKDGRSVVLRLEGPAAGREGLAELAVLAAVEHPGIAGLVDHGSLPGGGRFLARPWIEGEDLLAWSRGRARKPEEPERPESIGRVVAELCDALEHLHRLGFVHADLKPENVIVTPAGRPMLCDFGLARGAGAAPDSDGPDGVSGSLFTLAPEVLLGEAPTARADLFALGATLHLLFVGRRPDARSFYGVFPARSFFDAAGSSPDELPVWARDVVAGLVARDPERRPASAAAVAATLRARLGGAPTARVEGELRWPVGLGREAWMQRWFTSTCQDPEPSWIVVPEHEDAAAVASALRIHASLRGRTSRGVDLAQAAGGIENGVALDRWAVALARDTTEPWLVLHAGRLDPWTRRAADAVARACAQSRSTLPIVVATDGPEPGLAWERLELPPVAVDDVARFLAARLPEDDAERVGWLARLLHAEARGAAARLDRLLRVAAERGIVLVGETGHRLRPGPLPDALAPVESTADEVVADEAAREVLAALTVCGGGATPDELAALVTHGEESLGRTLVELSRTGRVTLSAGTVSATIAIEAENQRELHRRRADDLERRGAEAWRHLPHRLRAASDAERDDVALRLAFEVEGLADRGCPEIGLAVLDRVDAEHPRLAVARALCWGGLGQRERALQTVAPLLEADDPRVRALALLTRGRMAGERDEVDEALDCFRRALELDPGIRGEVLLGRAWLLDSGGRSEAVLEVAAELASLGGEAGLKPRQRVYVELVAAVAAFRLGRVDEARGELSRLVREAAERDDPGREAVLRLNLATVERRTGALERATEELERAVELYERSGLVAGLAHAQATLGGVLRERGELARSEPLLTAAIDVRERLGDEIDAAVARGMLGLSLAERGHARAAIEELERSAARMTGAQRRRFAPFLAARADEMRARIQASARASGFDRQGRAHPADGSADEPADPRVFLARARAAWLRRDPAAARGFAERAASLAERLGLDPVAEEARLVFALLEETPLPDGSPGSLAADDVRIHRLLATSGDDFDVAAAVELADDLARRGRDDRAARLLLAASARARDDEEAARLLGRAETTLARATAGLTASELVAFRQHLLGIPDPWPGDLIPRPEEAIDEEFEMEVASLLEINHLLVDQRDLPTLLGVIVENALSVTGAERGFLILEEQGELRFDTALDSRRGDVAQPDLEVSQSVVREALERMEPIRVSNAVDDPLLAANPSVVSLELRSILCTPFRVSDDLRGAIYVDHRLRSGAFSDRSERLCALLADQAALAILQIRRLDEIKSLNDELGERVVRQQSDLEVARRTLRAAGLPGPTGGLIGTSAAMQAVRRLIELAAKSDIAVLIRGASGTGKELAARALHDLSPRRNASFVTENCAAIPASLIESELFGYRQGAFTGADTDREGLFERASGGTFFLDEIGDMPFDLQAKLLRVLETGEVRRLGDSEPRKVDVRLVVATNRDLAREVEEKRFREDLYYRLNGLTIVMPTLAERPGDVAELVDHFLRLEEAQSGVRRHLSKGVLRRLSGRPWPGNVRELRNEIARLCVLCEGDLDDPSLVNEPELVLESARSGRPRTLVELERQAILDTLEFTGGDKRKAAAMLGISRAKIYQRLKEWDEDESGAEPRPAPGSRSSG